MCSADKPLTICDLSVTALTVSHSQANQVESWDNIGPDLLQPAAAAEIRDVSWSNGLTGLNWGHWHHWGFNFYKVKGRLRQAIIDFESM